MKTHASVVAVAALALASQAALAQVYRPESFGATSHTLELEHQAMRMDAFRASREEVLLRSKRGDKPEPLTFYGRLGNYAAENPGDGFTLRRATGPKVGNVSVGFRRKF